MDSVCYAQHAFSPRSTYVASEARRKERPQTWPLQERRTTIPKSRQDTKMHAATLHVHAKSRMQEGGTWGMLATGQEVVSCARLLRNRRAEEQSGHMSQVSVARQPESWLPNQIAVWPIRWRSNEPVFSITCELSILRKLHNCYEVGGPVCRLCFCWACCICSRVSERHLNVVYFGNVQAGRHRSNEGTWSKLPAGEPQIRSSSYRCELASMLHT